MSIDKISSSAKQNYGMQVRECAHKNRGCDHHKRFKKPDHILAPHDPKPPIQPMPPVKVPVGDGGRVKPLPVPLPVVPVGDDAEPGSVSMPVDPSTSPADPISLDTLA